MRDSGECPHISVFIHVGGLRRMFIHSQSAGISHTECLMLFITVMVMLLQSLEGLLPDSPLSPS